MESDLRSKHGYLRTYALRLLSLLASSDTAGREGGMPPHYCHVGQGLGWGVDRLMSRPEESQSLGSLTSTSNSGYFHTFRNCPPKLFSLSFLKTLHFILARVHPGMCDVTSTPLTVPFYSSGKLFLLFCAQRLHNSWTTCTYQGLLPMVPCSSEGISNHHRITSIVTALASLAYLPGFLPSSHFNLHEFSVLFERERSVLFCFLLYLKTCWPCPSS